MGTLYTENDVAALENYYEKRTFVMYSLFAVVPGKKTWPRRVFVAFCFLVLSFVASFQLMKFVAVGWDVQLIFEIGPTFAAAFATLLYLLHIVYATHDEFKEILTIMQNDLKAERTVEENIIKKKYAYHAKVFVNVYTVAYFMAMCGIPLSGLFPLFLDLIKPLNQTRQKLLLGSGGSFVDQEKYFYYIYLVESGAVCIVAILVGVSENMGVILVQHLCGMFAVIGRQLENIRQTRKSESSDKMSFPLPVESQLRVYIRNHQTSLKFANLMAEFYDIPLALVLSETSCTLTILLVQITDTATANTKLVLFTVVQLCQFFIINVMGQKLEDASAELSKNAYNAEWNVCSGNVRKLLQMVILRSSRPCQVVVRNMYTVSIANFVSVIQMSVSFYAMLRQVREM